MLILFSHVKHSMTHTSLCHGNSCLTMHECFMATHYFFNCRLCHEWGSSQLSKTNMNEVKKVFEQRLRQIDVSDGPLCASQTSGCGMKNSTQALKQAEPRKDIHNKSFSFQFPLNIANKWSGSNRTHGAASCDCVDIIILFGQYHSHLTIEWKKCL